MIEDGATVVHLTFQDETQIAKYKFRVIESRGVTLIHIKYDIRLLEDNSIDSGNAHIEVTIDSKTEELIYTYKILEKNTKNGTSYSKQIEKKQTKGNSSNVGDNDNSLKGNV